MSEQEPRAGAVDLSRVMHARRKEVDDADIAQALGGDRTTVSRVFSDQHGIKLSRLDAFLHVMGYRAIPLTQNIRELPEEHYQSLVVFAEVGAEAMRRGDIHPKYHQRRLKPCGPVRLAPSGGAQRANGAFDSDD